MNSILLRLHNGFRVFAALAALALSAIGVPAQTLAPNSISAAQMQAAGSNPVLKAMIEEMDRSKSQLHMQDIAKPYYIEYRVTDIDQYSADAAYGSIRQRSRVRARIVRAVVRVGDYKQDSYFGRGMGTVAGIPIGDDITALRHALWLATDEAYKTAGEALAEKQAMLKQFSASQTPVDDFAHADPVQSTGPAARLELNEEKVERMLNAATALYKDDPDLQQLEALAQFATTNEYFANSEGTVTSQGRARYLVETHGVTQAKDGMMLERSPYTLVATAAEVPSEEKLLSDTRQMIGTLKALREAPIVEEEYRGPVLISPDAADDVVATLLGDNVLGRKPQPGRSGRTVGQFASSYKTRVLPPFVIVTDDPTRKEANKMTLTGSYAFDNEGVKASAITVIDKGQLVNYLTSRQPIEDFPTSNGHGRAAGAGPPSPYYAVLELKGTETSSAADLKQRLIQMCKDQGKEYGYRIDTLAGLNSPRLLYRVWVKDGHEELVRGALLGELDIRGMRNDLIAVGNDPMASNRLENVPASVIAPSLLFDELEVRRDDRPKAKLPEYPAPAVGAAPARAAGSQQP